VDGEKYIMRSFKFLLFAKYYSDYQIKGNEMGGAYGTHVREEHLEDLVVNEMIILKRIFKK
jgi:hypothetical protein